MLDCWCNVLSAKVCVTLSVCRGGSDTVVVCVDTLVSGAVDEGLCDVERGSGGCDAVVCFATRNWWPSRWEGPRGDSCWRVCLWCQDVVTASEADVADNVVSGETGESDGAEMLVSDRDIATDVADVARVGDWLAVVDDALFLGAWMAWRAKVSPGHWWWLTRNAFTWCCKRTRLHRLILWCLNHRPFIPHVTVLIFCCWRLPANRGTWRWHLPLYNVMIVPVWFVLWCSDSWLGAFVQGPATVFDVTRVCVSVGIGVGDRNFVFVYLISIFYNNVYYYSDLLSCAPLIAPQGLKADHILFDWLINCVILNHFKTIKS